MGWGDARVKVGWDVYGVGAPIGYTRRGMGWGTRWKWYVGPMELDEVGWDMGMGHMGCLGMARMAGDRSRTCGM